MREAVDGTAAGGAASADQPASSRSAMTAEATRSVMAISGDASRDPKATAGGRRSSQTLTRSRAELFDLNPSRHDLAQESALPATAFHSVQESRRVVSRSKSTAS